MDYRPRLNKEEYNLVRGEGNRVLIIGDIHEPFAKKGYLEHCKSVYRKYNCNKVVFIGDLVDHHFSSFHSTDPDGHSAAHELDLAIANISKWYDAFPHAIVTIGNHDAIPARKAFNAGLSKSWIKGIDEVLNTFNWKYVEEYVLDEVKYTHGTGRKARQRAKDDFISIVQGHYHSESYIEYFVGEKYKMFAMQIGCGVDRTSYAMAYGKAFKKMHINCGVILDDGKLPILEYMDL